MGSLGFQELLLVLFIFLGFPFLFYWLGKRSGYKQGQLDLYRKMDEDKSNKP